MTLSTDLKKLYASGGTNVILHTLAFNHSTWTTPFYIVRDWQDFTGNIENSGPSVLFKRFAFSVTGPNKDSNGTQMLNIQVDSVSQELINLLETAVVDTNNVPIEVTYRVYIDSDTSGPQIDPPLKLYVRNIKADNLKVTAQAELINLVNKKFPSVVYGNTFQSLYHEL